MHQKLYFRNDVTNLLTKEKTPLPMCHSSQKSGYLCNLVLEFPIVNKVVALLKKKSDLTGSTETIPGPLFLALDGSGIIWINDNCDIGFLDRLG
jgi:hypothetical protein